MFNNGEGTTSQFLLQNYLYLAVYNGKELTRLQIKLKSSSFFVLMLLAIQRWWTCMQPSNLHASTACGLVYFYSLSSKLFYTAGVLCCVTGCVTFEELKILYIRHKKVLLYQCWNTKCFKTWRVMCDLLLGPLVGPILLYLSAWSKRVNFAAKGYHS